MTVVRTGENYSEDDSEDVEVFLAALSSFRSLVVRLSVCPSVCWSVHLCENVTFRLL